jgi:DNA repair protein SbcD/Mre11
MKIIHFADLHLGVENYGRIDPATGLSSRLTDFLAAFDQLVDYALENRSDLVIFSGDAYKTREPGQTQQREFAKRIARLSADNIPVFLLVGNHDLPNAVGRATATEIFDTLAVKNVYVAGRPDIIVIPTAAGNVQIAALPWLRRSALIVREDVKNLPLPEITKLMEQKLTEITTSLASRLDPSLPSILAAHVWVGGATIGSESQMSIGQEHAMLLGNIALPAFDYVALGHIHKHQVLNQSPPVVYSGSLERVDFSEEKDDKGFMVVDIVPGDQGKRQVSFDFHPVNARRFLTIDVKIEGGNLDPTSIVLSSITEQKSKIKDTIVRLHISLPSSAEALLRDSEIRDSLKEAHHFTIAREVKREARLRIGNRMAEELTPLTALKAYLDSQHISPERQKVLLEYGEKLLSSEE